SCSVKQIMEEAVTRKFVHEDSSHVIALCGVVEACLLHMLKRRAAGFLRTDKIAALFTKVGKTYDVASDVCKKAQELLQQVEGSRRTQPAGQESLKRQTSTTSKAPALTPQAVKHIWVRTALIERVLDKIVQYVVDNCSKYYEREALLADPVCGPILACLLVGPCALEYTKLKTADHFWTDPSADELVQRHRIHGAHGRQDSPSKRPALGIRKRHSSGSMSEDRFAASARDYVESLHQNSRTHLLYGKNNVLVQPKDDMEAIPGYLSLHQSADSLTLKWTPNQLMNGTLGDSELEKSIYWDYALIVPFSQIVCIHCHQQPERGATLVLVSQDGIQRPPLHFPPGGHLLAFLSCLENGLLPRGQLEPPLWSQQGKGKVFPKLRKRNTHNRSVDLEEMPVAMETAADYVFRIIYPGHRHDNSKKLLCFDFSFYVDDGNFFGSRLAYCRHLSTVRTHLSALVSHTIIPPDKPTSAAGGLTKEVWSKYQKDKKNYKELELLRRVYYGGVQHDIRKEVWPFLLGHYKFGMTKKEMGRVDEEIALRYQKVMAEWKACEVIVKLREKESQTATKFSSGSSIDSHVQRLIHRDSTISNDVRPSHSCCVRLILPSFHDKHLALQVFISVDEMDSVERDLKQQSVEFDSPDSGLPSSRNYSVTSGILSSIDDGQSVCFEDGAEEEAGTDPQRQDSDQDSQAKGSEPQELVAEEQPCSQMDCKEPAEEAISVCSASYTVGKRDPVEMGKLWPFKCCRTTTPIIPDHWPCWLRLMGFGVPTASRESHSFTLPSYSPGKPPILHFIEMLDTVALNLHRIDKDVQRCDRNYWYFTAENLEKLRNIMCSYVWEHLDVGYVQGMCDLLAPLMVILDKDELAYSCFTHLMKRMSQNFPNGGAMDTHFANMRSLIQILDSELFELMHQNGDYTHFYFCYRWFLLDFKRELLYEDVFTVWEVIWAASILRTFVLSCLTWYRPTRLELDFTESSKMAEHHNAQEILKIARDLVCKVQTLIENK
uniref:Small G protein signaling modulator 2 n=1 Tax=Podarcis muralis TaxID=64176 RepID=A0A670KCX3_PODMU